MTTTRPFPRFKSLVCLTCISLLSACGSSSDDNDKEGLLKFYNASANAPAIYLTLDEDLDEDWDDEVEQTYNSVAYGQALSAKTLPAGSYFYELAWQDEDSAARNDLQLLIEDSLKIDADNMTFMVMHNDIQSPQASLFSIPLITGDEEEEDEEQDRFNLRFLNTSADHDQLDIYVSKSDETFNEAELIVSASYMSMSDNIKLSQDQYIFYLTSPGSTEVLFESPEISYPYSTQYVVAIRANTAAVNSPFVIDNIHNNSISEYQSVNAQAKIRFYNGIQMSDLLPDYQASIRVDLIDRYAEITSVNRLQHGEFSNAYVMSSGDYQLNLFNAQNDDLWIRSQLLSLTDNSDRTLFYYLKEEAVDEDGDGDYDEDGDGQIDQYEAKIASLLVDNSTRERIYEHQVDIVHLAYSEDFSQVTFYFIKNNQSIDTAEYKRVASMGVPSSLLLRNNSYQVLAIASIEGTEVLIDSMSITLDEQSLEQFLLLQRDDNAPSGYKMKLVNQTPSQH